MWAALERVTPLREARDSLEAKCYSSALATSRGARKHLSDGEVERRAHELAEFGSFRRSRVGGSLGVHALSNLVGDCASHKLALARLHGEPRANTRTLATLDSCSR